MNTFYLNEVKPRLPGAIARSVTSANKRLSAWRHGPGPLPPMTNAQSLVLDGIVYTTIVNPFDPRKNWQDTLSAFLLALGDRADATLVVKVVAGPRSRGRRWIRCSARIARWGSATARGWRS